MRFATKTMVALVAGISLVNPAIRQAEGFTQ